MPFVKINQEQEQKEFEELIKDPAAKSAFDDFEREYVFRQKLAQVRKEDNSTQQKLNKKQIYRSNPEEEVFL